MDSHGGIGGVAENVFYTTSSQSSLGGYGVFSEGEAVYQENISNNEFVEKLNQYIINNSTVTSNWSEWTLGKDGYPTFK